jgi:hypothetical protein
MICTLHKFNIRPFYILRQTKFKILLKSIVRFKIQALICMSTVILAFQSSKTFYMKYYADQCHVRRPNYLYIY